VIVWLIGLSGAGKTTIGRPLTERLKDEWGEQVVYLDGDDLRDIWGDKLGHTVEARRVNAHRISHLCKLFDNNQIHAVASVLSIFPDWQEWNRSQFSSYFEIYLKTEVETVSARDPKGIYRNAFNGKEKNVVGLDIEFPEPSNPDMTIVNDATLDDVTPIVDRIVAELRNPRR